MLVMRPRPENPRYANFKRVEPDPATGYIQKPGPDETLYEFSQLCHCGREVRDEVDEYR